MPTAERERPVIGFLTDFGLDGAAATCRAVMLSICRDAQIVDIAHTVRKYAIRDGSFLLRFALPYFPIGVHVGVVDPGVGTARRPVAILTGRGDVLIGPDNGLLLPAADALGGAREARQLTNRDLWLPITSSTFHGRDIFSPVAGHLAAGNAAPEDVGPVLDPGDLVRLPEPAATLDGDALVTEAIYVDSFGNVRLAGGRPDLLAWRAALRPRDRLSVEVGRDGNAVDATYVTTFGEANHGDSVVYVDSSGNLAVGLNQGNFADEHAVQSGTEVRLRGA